MNKIFIIIIVALSLLSMDKYNIYKENLRQLIEYTKQYHNDIMKSDSPEEIAKSINLLSKKLEPVLQRIEIEIRSHPELVETECYNTKENFAEIMKELQHSTITIQQKIDKFSNNLVENEIKKLNSIVYKYSASINKFLFERSIRQPTYLDKNKATRCLKGDCSNGHGELLFDKSCTKYIGNFKNGIFHGKGILIHPNGSENGRWINGKRNGYFIYTANDGSKMYGKLIDDRFEGKFTTVFPNGYKSEYNYIDGKKNGEGIRYYSSGAKFVAHYKNDEIIGRVKYIYPSGSKYYGYWKNGNENGKGTMIFKNGSKYIGLWKDGEMTTGTYYLKDGRKYIGQFKNGKGHGKGTMFYPDGKIKKGNWENGEYNGE